MMAPCMTRTYKITKSVNFSRYFLYGIYLDKFLNCPYKSRKTFLRQINELTMNKIPYANEMSTR